MFLLDTNVVSELRKASSRRADPGVLEWARKVPVNTLFISVVSLMELRIGVGLVARRDPEQATALSRWFETQVLPGFRERILPIDLGVALKCAGLHVPDPRPERDALIAATALAHGLIVVTRNIRDFQDTGATTYNPWSV
ncbi:type II toxin-antitoxin system VapC family toxin [Pseudomonas sp. DC3200b2]|uniref:type II toxin-antitoxin system VapC family toxin n=1 Tax=Pseudomonas sp. DC3200b2 TaxID=2804669 RepID=UPI003CF8E458